MPAYRRRFPPLKIRVAQRIIIAPKVAETTIPTRFKGKSTPKVFDITLTIPTPGVTPRKLNIFPPTTAPAIPKIELTTIPKFAPFMIRAAKPMRAKMVLAQWIMGKILNQKNPFRLKKHTSYQLFVLFFWWQALD